MSPRVRSWLIAVGLSVAVSLLVWGLRTLGDDPLARPVQFSSPENLWSETSRFQNSLPEELRPRWKAIVDHLMNEYEFDGAFARLQGKTVGQVLTEYAAIADRVLEQKAQRRRMVEVACTGSAEEVQKLACPACGHGLKLRFDPQSPQPSGQKAGCLYVRCGGCSSGVVRDGMTKTPPWTQTLGLSIQTADRPEPASGP